MCPLSHTCRKTHICMYLSSAATVLGTCSDRQHLKCTDSIRGAEHTRVHVLREWADAPVCHLESLVCRHTTIMLKQMRQSERLVLQRACRLPSVEQTDEVETKVTLKPHDI